ncbi:hypothetical protein IM40_05665 [Candidatus Paracaedimonas acanthamoebae]|nr:hypothetical protein IM40_05665 [Candidatus Paracaedimonas acanthamoebae]
MTLKSSIMAAAILSIFGNTSHVHSVPLSPYKEVPNNFANIVEPLLPAVVNISTTTEVSANRRYQEMPNFPPGTPLDEFFRYFFEEGQPTRPRKTTSLGSGFIVSQEGKEAFIVTCNHVIADADEITVILHNDTELKATVVGQDRRTDLALLKVTTDQKLATVEWGDSSTARVGEWIIAVGNPFGLSSTVTIGIISTIARNISARAKGAPAVDYIDGYIQTDASLNMGNSGGPMFNINGKVIAISTAIFSPNGGNIGIGFGIPASLAKTTIEQIKKFGHPKRGWLGVTIQSVTPEIAESLNLKTTAGALVGAIASNSPATKAGIKRGDVILSFDGKPVKESRLLPRMVGEATIGGKVPLTIWRDGKEIKLETMVGEFEEAQQEGLIVDPTDDNSAQRTKGPKVLGMLIKEIKPAEFERYGVSEKGVIIIGLDPESEAAEKGLRPGDLISEVTIAGKRERITTSEQLSKLIDESQKQGKKQILLLINRGGIQRFITLALSKDKKETQKAE